MLKKREREEINREKRLIKEKWGIKKGSRGDVF
jgi:hypothetical protein